MDLKKLLFLVLFSGNGVTIIAQDIALKIGDKVPDLIFDKILNYKSPKGRLSDFKDKLIILDFWGVRCTSCIALFPKIQALQTKFSNELQIIPVGFEEMRIDSIEKFLARRKGTRYELKLPNVVLEYKNKSIREKFRRLFPFSSWPHEIWINENGYVIAITGDRDVNEINIDAILKDKTVNLSKKKIVHFLKPCLEPFLIERNKKTGLLSYGSALGEFNDTLSRNSGQLYNYINALGETGYSCDSTLWHIVSVNTTVIDLYNAAYQSKLPPLDGTGKRRMVIETHDLNNFYKDFRDADNLNGSDFYQFCKNNLFCYELILPRTYSREEIFKYIIQDIDRYFQIDSKIEVRKVRCLALVKTGDAETFKSNQSEFKIDYAGYYSDSILISNFPIQQFIKNILNVQIQKLPIINETGYEGNVDINLREVKNNDINSFRKAMRYNGLDLIEVEREIPMLVLRDIRK